MRIKILGKHWKLRFVREPFGDTPRDGDCDPPHAKNKEIRVSTAIEGERKMAVLIHEMLHAAGWHIDEPFVEQFAEDAARVIHEVGFREVS